MANETNAAPASPTPEEQLTVARSDGRAEGVASERTRIAAILDSDEAKGRGKLAGHLAFKTNTTADDARALLAAAAVDAPSTTPLAAAMQGVPNPQLGVDPGRNEGTEAVAKISSAAIYNARRQSAN